VAVVAEEIIEMKKKDWKKRRSLSLNKNGSSDPI